MLTQLPLSQAKPSRKTRKNSQEKSLRKKLEEPLGSGRLNFSFGSLCEIEKKKKHGGPQMLLLSREPVILYGVSISSSPGSCCDVHHGLHKAITSWTPSSFYNSTLCSCKILFDQIRIHSLFPLHILHDEVASVFCCLDLLHEEILFYFEDQPLCEDTFLIYEL